MARSNQQFLLAARPEGELKHSDFELVEAPVPEPGPLIETVLRDLKRSGVLTGGESVEVSRVNVIDPAYVVFTEQSRETVDRALSFLQEHELQELRRAVEHAAARIQAAGEKPEEVYWIDGNRYAEAGGTTIQYEHLPESGTLRVLEPFHHLDPVWTCKMLWLRKTSQSMKTAPFVLAGKQRCLRVWLREKAACHLNLLADYGGLLSLPALACKNQIFQLPAPKAVLQTRLALPQVS